MLLLEEALVAKPQATAVVATTAGGGNTTGAHRRRDDILDDEDATNEILAEQIVAAAAAVGGGDGEFRPLLGKLIVSFRVPIWSESEKWRTTPTTTPLFLPHPWSKTVASVFYYSPHRHLLS